MSREEKRSSKEERSPEDEDPVEINKDFRNVIVLDGLPKVDDSKFNKLVQVVAGEKWCAQFGTIVDFIMPREAGVSLGYAFCEFSSVSSAERAVADMDNKKFDKLHTLRANVWTDFDKVAQVKEEFVFNLDDNKHRDTHNWLLDPSGRDQYCVRYDDETEIHWNDPLRFRDQNFRETVTRGEEHKAVKGKKWTDSQTFWSSRGSYFGTFHLQGVALWGGDKFERRARCAHFGVRVAETSPCENYLITCNMKEKEKPEDPDCIIFWDIGTGHQLRGFDAGPNPSWPMFKWSHDDKYVARISKDREGKDAIFIYELPSFQLLDKKSLKVANVKDIQWSPTDNILSYWVPEQDNSPAQVTLVEIPSKRTVREKHLYGVSDLKMHWQSKGDYLVVKMSRLKKQKVTSTNFEVFRMRLKEIPVESIEIDQNAIAFGFEPGGHRFAFITEGQSNANNVDIFHIKKKKIELVHSLKARMVNSLFWSPAGGTLVVAGLGPLKGETIEFFDTDLGDTAAVRSHNNCTELEFDPSGRYVITSTTRPLGAVGSWKYGENGYRVFAYDGKGEGVWVERTKLVMDELYAVEWRPRPPTILNREQMEALKSSLKDKYWRKFEAEDEKWRAHFAGAEAEKKLSMRDEWKAYRSQRTKEHKDESEDRKQLRGGYDSDGEDEMETIEEIVETILSEETRIISVASDSADRRASERRESTRSATIDEEPEQQDQPQDDDEDNGKQ